MEVDELSIKKFLDQEIFDVWEEEVEVFLANLDKNWLSIN